jgi:hypothetical protein
MKWQPFDVLNSLAHTAWPILTRYFEPDCCIAATRIGLRVLQRFGVAGQALITWPLVGNDGAKRWMLAGQQGEAPDNMYVLDVDATGADATERSRPAEASFPGHLLITGKAQGKYYLLDLTAPQFNRADKGIIVDRPVLLNLGPSPFVPLSIELPKDGFLAYREHPNKALTFEDAPDWVIPDERKETFNRICAELVVAVEAKIVKTRETKVTRTGERP